MDKLSKILSGTKSDLFNIILNWEKITGVSNREIMIPGLLKNKILYVAVPNGMVAKTAVRFKHQITENINRCIGKNAVRDLVFTVDSSRFAGLEQKKPETEEKKPPISKKECAKKTENFEKQGISPSLAQTMAEIELLLKRDQEG